MNKQSDILKYITYEKEIPKKFVFDGSNLSFRFNSLFDGIDEMELRYDQCKRTQTYLQSYMPLEINAYKDLWFNISKDGHFELVDKDLTKKNYCLAAQEQTIFNYFAFLFYNEFWALMGHDKQQPLFVNCLADVLDISRDISYLFAITSKLSKLVFFKQSDCKSGELYGG